MKAPSSRRRLFAGDRVRALRQNHSLSQTAMAARLGISISYLSQIETGDRPITEPVFAALMQCFPSEWVGASEDDGQALMLRALQAGTDPAIPSALLETETVLRGVQQQPRLVQRMNVSHAAFQRSQDQLRALDDRVGTGSDESGLLPWEEVRNWYQRAENYIDVLDRAAERISARLDTRSYAMSAIVKRLRDVHRVEVSDALPAEDGRRLRDFSPESRVLFIDRAVPVESQAFEAAHQLMRLEIGDEIEAISRGAGLRSQAARPLLQVGLSNYAAAALLMPYERFRAEARRVRHDVDRLRQIFSVSFEQVCHRLSTLQRPAAQGTPFFFCRVDMAGNITKRHSATRMQFAQFGGTCPLWIVHEAVAIPDRILSQVAETPDGVRYISMAKGLVKATSSYRRLPRRYAVAIGCEIEHASGFVYGDGLDLNGRRSVTPIGTSCRICSRHDCEQRAFPPAGREIVVDTDTRQVVPYSFL